MPFVYSNSLTKNPTGFAKQLPLYPGQKEGTVNLGGSMYIQQHLLECCGLVGLSYFGVNSFHSFAEEAEYVEYLYGQTMLPGHIIYAITDRQSDTIPVNTTYEKRPGDGSKAVAEHKILLKCGAKMIAEFPNLNHGPAKIQIYLVNIRDAKGIYLDMNGKALKEDPTVKKEEPKKDEVVEVRTTKPRAKKVGSNINLDLNEGALSEVVNKYAAVAAKGESW